MRTGAMYLNEEPSPQAEQALRERLSLLADGALAGQALVEAVSQAAADPQARACWHRYHLVGDVLRSPDLARPGDDAAFLARFQQRLASEPPAEWARIDISSIALNDQPVQGKVDFLAQPEAANGALFRWRLVAGVAALATVGLLAWQLAGGVAAPAPGPQLAQGPNTTPAAAPDTPVMLRDARLDELLAAHRQAGGASALQMPAGFLRNATYEGPLR